MPNFLVHDAALGEGVVAPSTSRIPLGDMTTTSGGTAHFGPSCTRVIVPPASRIGTCPLSRLRTAFTNSRIGSGFFGANGSAPTSGVPVPATVAPRCWGRVLGSRMGVLQFA